MCIPNSDRLLYVYHDSHNPKLHARCFCRTQDVVDYVPGALGRDIKTARVMMSTGCTVLLIARYHHHLSHPWTAG